MLLFSVVIPALNEEQLLPITLASLNNQDVDAAYEIIVVDNGSVDRTPEVARESGAKVIYSPGRGVACARQAGLEAAQGTFVVQADADTEYARDWLSRILQAFKLNPDAVAVAGGFRYREPKTFESAEWIMRNLANMGSQAFTGRLLMVSGANFGFYRKALLACGGYRQHAFSADQYDVAARLSRLGRIIYDPHLNAITSARRVQRPALEIAVLFMRFVMGLHLNIFRFFFIDQFREWMPSGNSKVRIMKYIHTSASMLFTFAFTLLAIWGYFVVFKLPLPFNTP